MYNSYRIIVRGNRRFYLQGEEKDLRILFKNNMLVVGDMNKIHKQYIPEVDNGPGEIREEDEPPPNSTNSFSDRVYRVVHGIASYLSINPGGEDIDLYSGLGRRTIGMERTIQFPLCSDISN